MAVIYDGVTEPKAPRFPPPPSPLFFILTADVQVDCPTSSACVFTATHTHVRCPTSAFRGAFSLEDLDKLSMSGFLSRRLEGVVEELKRW